MPQPNFGPFTSSTSRSTHSRGISGSTSTSCGLPFTVSLIIGPLSSKDRDNVNAQEEDCHPMVRAGLLVFLLAFAPFAASQDPYPSKPVRIVIGYAAGGGNDIIVRVMVPELSKGLGQP